MLLAREQYMSFAGTPLGQGRRLDHNTFLNKPPSQNNHQHDFQPRHLVHNTQITQRDIPTSYAYGYVQQSFVARVPLTLRKRANSSLQITTKTTPIPLHSESGPIRHPGRDCPRPLRTPQARPVPQQPPARKVGRQGHLRKHRSRLQSGCVHFLRHGP